MNQDSEPPLDDESICRTKTIPPTNRSDASRDKIAFSRGFRKYDNSPEQRSASNASEFLKAISEDRGRAKGEQWISAPFAVAPSDPLHLDQFPTAIGAVHRCGACVQACGWLGLDIDVGMTPLVFEQLQNYLRREHLLGVVYTTASHTDDNPRCRIILMLDRPLDRADRMHASSAMRARCDAAMRAAGCLPLTWDRSCDRPEQPLYLPLENCRVENLAGEPLSADSLLAEVALPIGEGESRDGLVNVDDWLADGKGNHPAMLVMVARMIHAKMDNVAIHAAVQSQTWHRPMPKAEVQRAIDGARGKVISGVWGNGRSCAQDEIFDSGGTPEPLRRTISSPEKYPIHALGPLLQPAAEAIQRVIQAPEAIIGSSLLATASLAVQAQADVSIDGRERPLSLWFLSVAESGERKSAVDTESMRAVHEHERALLAAHAFEFELYSADLAEWEAKRDALKIEAKKARGEGLAEHLRSLGPPPLAPLLPRVTAADFTAEGLFKLLSVSRPAIGAFTDEAALVFGGHGMSKESVMRTAGTLCKLWDSGTLDRVRSGDGAQKLYGRRLALHLLAQPVIAERALSDDVLAGQGFMARCLLAWPAGTAGTRAYCTEALLDDPAMQRLNTIVLDRLRLPLPVLVGDPQALQPRALSLSPDAKGAWIELHNAVEREMRPDGRFSQVKPWASKTPEQALRIAGVLTLLEDAGAVNISRATMERATTLANWHLNEALRLASTAELPPEILDAEALLRWAHDTGRQFIHSREVLQFGPNRIRERSTFQRAVGELVRAGWAIPVEGGMRLGGAHRRNVWTIHASFDEVA